MSVFEFVPSRKARRDAPPEPDPVTALHGEIRRLREELLQSRLRETGNLERFNRYLIGLEHRVQALETLLRDGPGRSR